MDVALQVLPHLVNAVVSVAAHHAKKESEQEKNEIRNNNNNNSGNKERYQSDERKALTAKKQSWESGHSIGGGVSIAAVVVDSIAEDTGVKRLIESRKHSKEEEVPWSEGCTFDWRRLNAGNCRPNDVIKCLFIGESATGKTECAKRMLGEEKMARYYQPTVFETYRVRVTDLFKPISVEMWDLSGDSNKYAKKRPAAYSNVDTFVAVFSLSNPSSWSLLRQSWIPEVMQYKEMSLFVVGTHLDCINYQDAGALQKFTQLMQDVDRHVSTLGSNFRCARFHCVSSATGEGLDALFRALVYATLYGKF